MVNLVRESLWRSTYAGPSNANLQEMKPASSVWCEGNISALSFHKPLIIVTFHLTVTSIGICTTLQGDTFLTLNAHFSVSIKLIFLKYYLLYFFCLPSLVNYYCLIIFIPCPPYHPAPCKIRSLTPNIEQW
jgi:hypothetical protein